MDVCHICRDEKRVERKRGDIIRNVPPSSLAGRQAGNLKKSLKMKESRMYQQGGIGNKQIQVEEMVFWEKGARPGEGRCGCHKN